MMWWCGNGMNGWVFAFMTVSMILFWGLVICGVITLVRHLARGDRSGAARPTAGQVLAERFERGEIDEQEYRGRLDALRDRPEPLVKP